MTQKSSDPRSKGKIDNQIALALQGGGAFGSYQAGVYEALAECDYQPDWVGLCRPVLATRGVNR
jgi:NTE family protein